MTNVDNSIRVRNAEWNSMIYKQTEKNGKKYLLTITSYKDVDAAERRRKTDTK